jgi:hypothetical protein
MAAVIDSDQHLVEGRTMWRDHIDPGRRDDALAIEDDDLGYPWLTWRGRRLSPLGVQTPGLTEPLGEYHERVRRGEPAEASYDELLPRDHWDPAARLQRLDAMGVDEAVVFPNYGLLWERTLDADLDALAANMSAWNRWCASVVTDGRGRVHPVAHMTLRDEQWALRELDALERAGVKLAMVAPALVDGRPLSHPDHDVLWRAFVAHGVTPVFHVADQRRPFGDGWYTEPESNFLPPLESVFLWVPAALAATDLVLNGVFDRIDDLRFGIVELSAIWVPMYVLMLDGGFDFTSRLNGRPIQPLRRRPSEYIFEQFRISSFAYELPGRLAGQTPDIYMCCSDYPHSEGTAHPLDEYRAPGRYGVGPDSAPALFHENVEFLLRK